MTDEKKMALLEDVFEDDADTLTPQTVLEELDSWDSMAKLSLIVLVDDHFTKKLSGDTIKGFKTVQDILDYMD